MTDNKPWYVIVERWAWPSNDVLPPYGIGPIPTAEQAKEEANSECSQAYEMLTIDAKNQNYQAVECYWGQSLPENTILWSYIPPEKDDKND